MITFFNESGECDIDKFMLDFTASVKDKNQAVAIICRTGNRSIPVSDILLEQGYNVFNVKNGIIGWIQDKKRVVMPNFKDAII